MLLFGLPGSKDAEGSSAWDDDGVVQRGVRAIRAAVPDLPIITDVCLCQFTDHGSCGVLGANGDVDNDATIELLARVAVSHAEAGADFVAPSDMMDGRVGAIRARSTTAALLETGLISYTPKYASAFYGPFRGAVAPAPRRAATARGTSSTRRTAARAPRVARRRRGGRRHADGQAGRPVPRRDRAARDSTLAPIAAFQVSGEHGDARGGRRARVARPRGRGARVA